MVQLYGGNIVYMTSYMQYPDISRITSSLTLPSQLSPIRPHQPINPLPSLLQQYLQRLPNLLLSLPLDHNPQRIRAARPLQQRCIPQAPRLTHRLLRFRSLKSCRSRLRASDWEFWRSRELLLHDDKLEMVVGAGGLAASCVDGGSVDGVGGDVGGAGAEDAAVGEDLDAEVCEGVGWVAGVV